jgi:5-methylcytosine-specific restriction endonuclease McrA
VKTCSRCRVAKPLDAFHRRARAKDGLAVWCKPCVKAYNRARYLADPEVICEATRQYRAANAERVAEAKRVYRAAHPEQRRDDNHRRRARRIGAAVGRIDWDALDRAVNCYLCGQPLAAPLHLDHIIPLARNGAHSTLNLAWTHEACNLRKSDQLLSELAWYAGPVDMGHQI